MSLSTIQKKTHPQVRLLIDIREGKNKTYLFCEGEKTSQELFRTHWPISMVFCRPDMVDVTKSMLCTYKKEATPTYVLSNDLMSYVSDLQTPPGLIVIAKRNAKVFKDIEIEKSPLLLILHQQQLPQNLGGMIRSAEAAGVNQVWVTSNTVDPFHPKVIRGSSGSVFRMPVRQDGDLKQYISDLKSRQIVTVAADQNGSMDYELFNWCKPTALIMGTEGKGLTDSELGLMDHVVRIPMKGALESINVGVAAAVCLFEAARQRRKQSS